MKCQHQKCTSNATKDFVCSTHGIKNCTDKTCEREFRRYVKCEKHSRWIRHSSKDAVKAYVDYDYLHKLNDEEKEWLREFNKEFYFNTFGSIHQLKAGVVVTKERRRKSHNDDDSRRRCVNLSHAKPLTPTNFPNEQSPLDAIITAIDLDRGFKPDDTE